MLNDLVSSFSQHRHGRDLQEVTDVADGEARVVVLLFKDGREDCDLLYRLLLRLAQKNPQTKFTRIFYSNAVRSWISS